MPIAAGEVQEVTARNRSAIFEGLEAQTWSYLLEMSASSCI